MFRCFQSFRGTALSAIVTAVALYLIFWHGVHLAALAPALLLLSCPLMHLMGHGGHRHHHGQDDRQDGKEGRNDPS